MSKQASDLNPFADLTNMLEQFKVPGLDMAPIVEARRKDMEALVEVNKSTFESMQALARKQTEILTQTMQALQESAKGMVGSSAAKPDLAKQAELARDAYEKALADMRDLGEMARKSQTDAMAAITQRAAQSLQEMKKLTQPK